jgi:hypothetical protein
MDFNNKLQAKPQGVRSNTRGVQQKLREHILSRYTDRDDFEGKSPVEALRGDVESAAYSIEGNPRGEVNLVKGGNFEVYYEPVKEFVESLGLRKSKPEYSDDETWNLYVSLMAREIKNLINNPKLAEKLLKPIVPAAKPEEQPAAQPAPAPIKIQGK